jgi:hypothetical protein
MRILISVLLVELPLTALDEARIKHVNQQLAQQETSTAGACERQTTSYRNCVKALIDSANSCRMVKKERDDCLRNLALYQQPSQPTSQWQSRQIQRPPCYYQPAEPATKTVQQRSNQAIQDML